MYRVTRFDINKGFIKLLSYFGDHPIDVVDNAHFCGTIY